MKITDIINEEYNNINRNNIYSILDDYYFQDENIGYHHRQSDNRVYMYDKSEKQILAKIYYSIYNGEINITFIESIVKGKGYGKILMIYLAKEYGYENLERTSLTPDGAKMRKELDSLFNFDYRTYKESQTQHIQQDVIDKIKPKHPIVAAFMFDMIKYGYEKTWEKWVDYLRDEKLLNKYDFNDISEITTWIRDSVTNNHDIDQNPPEYIYTDLDVYL